PIAMLTTEVDWLPLTKVRELTAVRATLAPALGTHRHAAATVTKASNMCLLCCVFNLVANMGESALTVIPEVVLM
ncbi:MAG: hypothetical protein KH264_08705, partial [Actinomyces graevenitzii]|nr:hypothetical protein [Actinomyces graevenitzii]